MIKKFQRKPEDFTCEQCGMEVKGTGYTDHCPACLCGKHVDIFPGDRLEDCHGLLKPVGILKTGNKESLEYQCQRCGELRKNKVAENDSVDALVQLARELASKFSH